MACWESPIIEKSEIWSSLLCNITVNDVLDGSRADITVLPYRGQSDRFTATENAIYTYNNVERPFTLLISAIMQGFDGREMCMFKVCEIESIVDTPPSDLLGMLTYVKDKIVALVASVGAVIVSLTNIDSIVNNVRVKIDEAKDLITGLSANINYELDIWEINLRDELNALLNSILTPLQLYKEDTLEAIRTITLPDIGGIQEDLKAEIIQLGQNLSTSVITDMWEYIEDQLFDKEDE